MKTSRVSLLLLGPAFVFGLALPQEGLPATESPEAAVLQDQVTQDAESEAKRAQELEALEKRVAALEKALREQAAAAAKMQKSLELVEKQGFTAGINYKSRITLLSALRDWTGAMKGLVEAPAAAPDKTGVEKDTPAQEPPVRKD